MFMSKIIRAWNEISTLGEYLVEILHYHMHILACMLFLQFLQPGETSKNHEMKTFYLEVTAHKKCALFNLHGSHCNVPSLDNTSLSELKSEDSVIFMCSVKYFASISKCAFIMYW